MQVADSAYERLRVNFTWDVPERFNIGLDICDKWADRDPNRVAIIEYDGDRSRSVSFGALKTDSNKLAHLLAHSGLQRGDRCGILLPQRVETVLAHIAIYKSGAIAVPLFSLFGLDALLHRLKDSGARVLVTDNIGLEKIKEIRDQLPDLESIVCIEDEDGRACLETLTSGLPETFLAVDTAADDPALIIYTSGTTGSSKGALHAHRVLLGHLPGVEMVHGGRIEEGDCFWTPADWAWIGGLFDILMPALHHGVPVVAYRFPKFDSEAAFRLMAHCGVRNVFIPPTALKLMRAYPNPREDFGVNLRSLASGGETLGGELLEWGRSGLGVEINEMYGQTECNLVICSCDAWFAKKPDDIGKPVLGHDVAILGENGKPVSSGEEGAIAIRSPDPVMFLGYWNKPDATAEKFMGDWLITGDRGIMDGEGFVHFLGRDDDVITSAGYRIGPGEIEDCLLRHPAVEQVGVIGVPDAARTEVVTAFVVLCEGFTATNELVAELQDHVRSRMGGHQYPRRVEFMQALPLTITGKVIRRELRAIAVNKA